MLASGPLKILAVYLSPSGPIVGSELSACFGGGIPVLMVGDLNAKHIDWNSWLTKTRGKLLSDYASGNSWWIYEPDSPTTPSYNSRASHRYLRQRNYQGPNLPGVSDGVLNTKLRSPSCTDRHDVPIILSQPAYRPYYRRTGWVKFQASLEDRLPSTPLIPNKGEIDTCEEEMSSAVLEAVAASTPESRPRDGLRPQLPATIQDEIA
jgi:hypothetical protein